MLSPGGGAGNKAAAVQIIKALLPALLHASMAFEGGSKEQNAALESVRALRIFGKAEGANMVPAGLATLAQNARKGPLSAAPPPGLMPTDKPPPDMPMPPVGGESEAA
jgi:hypothetical protein